jgi:UPF0716 protein FxsA
MSNLTLFLFLFTVALPLLEIALLIKVGSVIGVAATIALIISTAVIGSLVVRHQGLGIARRMVEMSRSGEHPALPVLEGMLLLFAGGCLIAPGIITDVVGLILLIPPIRRFAASWLLTAGIPMAQRGRRRPSRPNGDGRARSEPAPTIDGDFERIEEKTVEPDREGRPPPARKP